MLEGAAIVASGDEPRPAVRSPKVEPRIPQTMFGRYVRYRTDGVLPGPLNSNHPSSIFIRNVGLAVVVFCVPFLAYRFFAYPGAHAPVGRQRNDYSASHSLSWQESHPHVVTLVDFAQRRISGG